MKLFISLDMEGISGIINAQDVVPGEKNYEYCRRLLTMDVNAAIEGALEAGATEIVVNESHGPMNNVLVEELNPKAELIRGFYKPLCMMEGIDETFDAAFFIGYHGRAGAENAILNHTLTGVIQRLWLNGREVGEAGLNAAVAGAFGVPVVLVSGDSQTAAEVEVDIPGIHTAVVKQGISSNVARCLHPTVAHELIRQKAKAALASRSQIKPLKKEESYTLEIEFKSTLVASVASWIPGTQLLDPRTIRFEADDICKIMPVVLTMVLLGVQVSK